MIDHTHAERCGFVVVQKRTDTPSCTEEPKVALMTWLQSK